MALQTSGQISLNDIHVEAGGTTGTVASINDADIRALIGKSSGVQMSFSEWYGASAALLNTTMTVGTAQSVSKFYSVTYFNGTTTINGTWVAYTGSAGTFFLRGYDGGAGAFYDDITIQNGGYFSVWEQNNDNFGSMGNTSVSSRTILYLYTVNTPDTNKTLYLGFTGTDEVTFTALTVNGNGPYTKANATTGTWAGNRYYLWDTDTDGVSFEDIPASGTINITIT
jgi:hypothetical protein